MVGVTHACDVWVKRLERVLRMARGHAHRLRDLLVHYDIDLDALFRLALQNSIQTPFWVVRGWTAKEQLWSKPPILLNTIAYEKRLKDDYRCHGLPE